MSAFLDREALDTSPGCEGDEEEEMSDDPDLNSYSKKFRGRKSNCRGNPLVESESEEEDRCQGSARRSLLPQMKRNSSSQQSNSTPSINEGSSSQQSNSTPSIDQSNKENAPNVQQLMSEVKRSNELLVGLVSRVKRNEKRLKDVENHLKNSDASGSSSGSTPKRRKRDVPDEVRVCQSNYEFKFTIWWPYRNACSLD